MDAVAVPSTASTHYVDFLMNRRIPRFGVPEVIITDQARGSVNKRTTALYSAPYWPQSNGLVERMLGSLKQVLRKIFGQRHDWSRALNDATLAINVSKPKHSDRSPFWLMHGYNPKLSGELNIGSVDEDISESERLHEIAKSRDETRASLRASQGYSRLRCGRERGTPDIRTGDTVLLQIGARSGTLDARFDGPYEVTNLLGDNLVTIRRISPERGKLNVKTVNVEQIRLYNERDLNPAELFTIAEGPGDLRTDHI